MSANSVIRFSSVWVQKLGSMRRDALVFMDLLRRPSGGGAAASYASDRAPASTIHRRPGEASNDVPRFDELRHETTPDVTGRAEHQHPTTLIATHLLILPAPSAMNHVTRRVRRSPWAVEFCWRCGRR